VKQEFQHFIKQHLFDDRITFKVIKSRFAAMFSHGPATLAWLHALHICHPLDEVHIHTIAAILLICY